MKSQHIKLKDYYKEKCDRCRNWGHNQKHKRSSSKMLLVVCLPLDQWNQWLFFDIVNFSTVKRNMSYWFLQIWWISFSNEKLFFLCFLCGFSHPDSHVKVNCHIWETLCLLLERSFLHKAHFNVDEPVIYPSPQHLNAVTCPPTLPLPATRFNLRGRSQLHHLSPWHVPHPSKFPLSPLCAGHSVCGAARAEVRTRQLWSLPVTSACDLGSEWAGKQRLPLLAFSLWS